MRWSICLASLLFVCGSHEAWATSINLSSGQNAAGMIQTAGDLPDAHWMVTGASNEIGTNPARTVFPNNADSGFPSWIANSPQSDWIAFNPDVANNGTGTYFETFDLTGIDLSTVSITGSWTLDDAGTLMLNGHLLGTLLAGGWTSLHSFSVPLGSPFFNQGLNTLTMHITASDDFLEGVRLQGTLTTVPEPGTLALVATSGLLALRRRRHSSR